MSNLLVVGETNNGKTMIVNRFAKRHPADVHIGEKESNVPVLLVQAPPVPDEGRLYNAILDQLYAPFRPSSRVDQRQLQVMRLLDAIGIRVIIIDEIHHILAGTMAKQRHFLNVIKYIGNELRISIVGVGTRDAFNAIHTDPQLANRFEPALLPKWQMGDDYLRLLASFERLVNLKDASNLTKEDLALKLLGRSEGTIGEISRLVADAAAEAIKDGTEKITAATVDKCPYISPSERRRATI